MFQILVRYQAYQMLAVHNGNVMNAGTGKNQGCVQHRLILAQSREISCHDVTHEHKDVLGQNGQRFPLQLGLEEERCLSVHRSSGKLTSQKPGGSMISNPTSKANSLAPAAVHTTRPRVKRCESRFRMSSVVPTGNCLRLRIMPPYMLMTSVSTGSHSSVYDALTGLTYKGTRMTIRRLRRRNFRPVETPSFNGTRSEE